ncbi:hypothetical protein JCM8097_009405 [Rhodosporidiobolus ruineniae]
MADPPSFDHTTYTAAPQSGLPSTSSTLSGANKHASELPTHPSRLSPVPAAQLAPPGPALEPFPGPIPSTSTLSSADSSYADPQAQGGQGGGGGAASAAPPPSFQDLTDDEGSESEEGSEDWEAWVQAATSVFTETEIAQMHDFLRERGLFRFLKEYLDGPKARPVSTVLLAFGVMVRPDTPMQDQVRMLKIACSRVLRNRAKLEDYNTPDNVVELVRRSRKILVLTGAGVSTSCGIPDFRSSTGLYARLKEGHLAAELDDPQDMFDLAVFKERPGVFYGFAKEIYPSNFVPSPCHRFVKLLELNDRLLRNYTQNIDGLFEQVGVEKMLNCHGSFATASCLLCRRRFPGSAIEADVFASRVPLCPYCTAEQAELEKQREAERAKEPPRKKKKTGRAEWEESSDEDADGGEGDYGRSEWEGKAVIKPDITFFGEALSDEFDRRLLEDRDEVDLLIVMGTSLRVSPVAQLPSHLPHSVPQILINRDPVAHHQFDVCLLGDGDGVVQWLCEELAKSSVGGAQEEVKRPEGGEWDLDHRVPVVTRVHASTSSVARPAALPLPSTSEPTPAIPSLPATVPSANPIHPERVGGEGSHVWLFPGANREHRWVKGVAEAYEEHAASADGRGSEAEDEDGEGAVPEGLQPGGKEGGEDRPEEWAREDADAVEGGSEDGDEKP